jgi:hypothetical protein
MLLVSSSSAQPVVVVKGDPKVTFGNRRKPDIPAAHTPNNFGTFKTSSTLKLITFRAAAERKKSPVYGP